MKRRPGFRGERLGEEMRRIISELISRELKDPVFQGMISISHVRSSDDGSFATVFFTSLDADNEAVLAGFENAKGFIRTEIGQRLGIRRAPELRFRPDDAELHGQRIDSILNGLDLPAEGEGGRMKKEVRFDELTGILNAYESYLIFTHVHMDGDTLGSAVALAESMREIGKEAWVLIGEEVPRTLALLNMPCVVLNEPPRRKPYLSIAVDFTDVDRLEGREEVFAGGQETLSIDHHAISKPSCDYNYIEPGAAATAELIFRLLKSAGLPITERVATALYFGLVTDTGRFQYTNTTADSHRIAAELFDAGADFKSAFREIYQNIKAEKLFVQREMFNTIDIFAGGKAVLAFVHAETLDKYGAGEDETDGMSEVLRGIIGVEVSVFLKERPEDGKIKASMRSKEWFDVAALAAEFGGGGHIRAAGFTSEMSLEEVKAAVKEKLTEGLSVK